MKTGILLRALTWVILLVPIVAQNAKAQHTAKRVEARFEKIEHAVQRMHPRARHRYPEQILAAALLAESSKDQEMVEEWRAKLWGDDTPANGAFRQFRLLLRGELENVFDLFDALPYAKWYTLAASMKKSSPSEAMTARYDDAETVLHMFALCGVSGGSSLAKVSVKAVTTARGDLQRDLIKALRAASKREKHKSAIYRLRSHLRYALRAHKLEDPTWCELLTDLTTTSYECVDILRSLRENKNEDLAVRIALRASASHPTDEQVQTAALGVLLRTDDGEKALSVLLDAEDQLPYPAKRSFRIHYFRTLRSELSRGSRRHLPRGMLSYGQEREEREYAASWTDDLEAQMALADLYSVEQKTEDAAGIYRDVCLRASETTMVWTAWSAWADLRPSAAWDCRQAVESMSSSTKDLPVATNTFFSTCFAVAIAAEGLDAALEWATGHIKSQYEAGKRHNTLLSSLASIAWVRRDERYCTDLLQGSSDTERNAMLSIILDLPRGGITRTAGHSPHLLKPVSLELKKHFEGRECWTRATDFLLKYLPSYQSPDALSTAWQTVARAYPDNADTESVKRQKELSQACLKWADARQDDGAALKTILQGAAYLVYQGYGLRVEQNAAGLFFPCLERAAERDILPSNLRIAVSYYLKGLAKSKTGEHTVTAARSEIARIYPGLRENG